MSADEIPAPKRPIANITRPAGPTSVSSTCDTSSSLKATHGGREGTRVPTSRTSTEIKPESDEASPTPLRMAATVEDRAIEEPSNRLIGMAVVPTTARASSLPPSGMNGTRPASTFT